MGNEGKKVRNHWSSVSLSNDWKE